MSSVPLPERMRAVVFGAGGHARVVADLVEACGAEVLGFLDEKKPAGTPVGRLQVLGGAAWLAAHPGVLVALGIGDARIRREVYEAARAQGARCPGFVHPRATVSPSAQVGAGTVVLASAVINADARVGVGVIVNSAAVIEHDCDVGDFAHLSPNATLAGAARVGTATHVGAGATVLPGVSIGDESTIGAGAVVNKPLPGRVVALGVPARILREKP